MAGGSRNGSVTAVDAAPELAFAVEGVEADRYATVPTLRFKLAIERAGGGAVRSIALHTQLRIAANRRSYGEREQQLLVELFGRGEQWKTSLHSIPWTNAFVQVPGFSDATVVELPVVCTYDFEVTAAKYFAALADGEVPLELLFSGTIFYAAPDGALRIVHVPWEKEAEHRLPVATWREMMDRHFPGSAWLRLRRESFERLYAYRVGGSFLNWEDALDALLDCAESTTGARAEGDLKP